jgi:hypothetical protein
MRSEFAFLFPKPIKVRKARKTAAKAVTVGATVVLHMDGKEYTVAARDDRYKNAWFLVGAPYSVSRDMFKVI